MLLNIKDLKIEKKFESIICWIKCFEFSFIFNKNNVNRFSEYIKNYREYINNKFINYNF